MTDNQKPELKIEHIPVNELTPYVGNARTHSEQQVAQIANSMTEFGFVNPILLGKDNIIIAGHGRLLAAKMLGVKTVPVIHLKHLPVPIAINVNIFKLRVTMEDQPRLKNGIQDQHPSGIQDL